MILSEIDSRNGPIKLAYFVTSCSKYIYIYRTSSNLYTPDSVSLASLARQLGVYPNKTPLSRRRSPRVREFCSDIPRSNHGITILYPKSSSHRISLYKIIRKMVIIIVKIVTKLDHNKYNYSC